MIKEVISIQAETGSASKNVTNLGNEVQNVGENSKKASKEMGAFGKTADAATGGAVTKFKAFTLNFGTEVDEYELSSNSNSIYNTFYKSYIQRVFNPKGRMFTFKAKLPQRVLLNYELNDVFIINGKQYIINSIDTDLMTGISNLQLINKLTESVATDLSNSTLFDNLNLIS